jgi:hypothetical protein
VFKYRGHVEHCRFRCAVPGERRSIAAADVPRAGDFDASNSIHSCAQHSDTDQRERLWIDICGETDISTHGQLVAGLTTADWVGVDVVHVGLARMGFCDVRGLLHLLSFANDVRRSGRDVVVHDASHMVLKMVNLLGMEHQPQVA